jgi:ribosomal protein S27E
MAEHFINLNCANCGAKLEVYGDMDRLACGYCGTELVVQRRGGTVVLKAVTEAIRKVQIGTDKTAAELAIARHEKELAELSKKRGELEKSRGGYDSGVGCAALLILLALIFLANAAFDYGGVLIIVGGVTIWLCVLGQKEQNAQMKVLESAVKETERQLAEKKKIADG